MPTPVPAFDILVSSKDEVVRDMALLAEELWDVASMAHGPTGRCIVIQPNKDCGDACIVTSSAKRIMEHLRLTSSMGTLFAQYVQSHLKQHRDGGLFCIMLASSMLRRVHSALESIPKHRLFSGLRLAQDWALDELHDMQDDLDWSDAEAIAAVVRGIVSPKFVANVSESTVATLMQVFVQHLPWLLEHPTIPPIVRVVASRQRLPGVNDVVMHHTVLIPGRRHVTHLPLRNVKVVLFNVTIRPSPTPTSDIEVTVKVDSETYHSVMAPSTSGLVQEAEMAGWTAVTKRLKSCGVQMVLSQKKIPAFLAARLSDVGIASIERLSIQHIGWPHGPGQIWLPNVLCRCSTSCDWSSYSKRLDGDGIERSGPWNARSRLRPRTLWRDVYCVDVRSGISRKERGTDGTNTTNVDDSNGCHR
ncbi:hypothetical protein, variant [Aphanomyces invadans]|uniref:Uncharacterized protein n=1 Tax=Aphanomyces invadans TaxID=157072 RepID=A0A024TSE3_9STRA|nr:hypothetical protein, variant [Aphanomyces invadans]ETV96272.1 hypothetical protein, variant [Aphanomyces invadans]|eukprot:XP_008875064.1 hypothetical protein, variant [Aphanomyces invadans]